MKNGRTQIIWGELSKLFKFSNFPQLHKNWFSKIILISTKNMKIENSLFTKKQTLKNGYKNYIENW